MTVIKYSFILLFSLSLPSYTIKQHTVGKYFIRIEVRSEVFHIEWDTFLVLCLLSWLMMAIVQPTDKKRNVLQSDSISEDTKDWGGIL